MTTTEADADAATADWLLSPEAIRTQCGALYAAAEAGDLPGFTLHPENLGKAAEEVVATIRAAYPDLQVPPHARWRHFVLAGRDRWAEARAEMNLTPQERCRLECELAIVSVLLDAGAGPQWSYADRDTDEVYTRSEGLALGSMHMFLDGAFGNGRSPGTTLAGLTRFGAADLSLGFQVDAKNPLEGLHGRAALISALGEAVKSNTLVFGDPPRLGHIADHLFGIAGDDALPARDILRAVLDLLGPIWPTDRPRMAGRPLGDCWPHPLAPGPGLVPFHKLSQWLSYSLIEPLRHGGVPVSDLDTLTGLAEYRNGGLFLDTGVIALRDPEAAAIAHDPGSPLIVEWRALTVCLLDRVAEAVRDLLGHDAETLPLASILEGGTWATGRRLARAARDGGPPPLTIRSTGTVF